MCFNAIRENKILAKNSESTVFRGSADYRRIPRPANQEESESVNCGNKAGIWQHIKLKRGSEIRQYHRGWLLGIWTRAQTNFAALNRTDFTHMKNAYIEY